MMAGFAKCKPVAGYPSMKLAILGLAKKGLDREEIAQIVNTRPDNVSSYFSILRREGKLPRLERDVPDGHMPLKGNVRALLERHAEKRGITPQRLAERLLTVIAGEDLVDAVLDDAALDDGEGSACAS